MSLSSASGRRRINELGRSQFTNAVSCADFLQRRFPAPVNGSAVVLTCIPCGSACGPVIVPVFKTGGWQVILSLVGSTPTRFRHFLVSYGCCDQFRDQIMFRNPSRSTVATRHGSRGCTITPCHSSVPRCIHHCCKDAVP